MARNRSAGTQAPQTSQAKLPQQAMRTRRPAHAKPAPDQSASRVAPPARDHERKEAQPSTPKSRRKQQVLRASRAASDACHAASDACAIPQRRIRIGSPVALLAAVPVLLGFQPGDSMVVIGTEQPRNKVKLTLRYNLPDPPDARLAAELARHAMGVLAAQHIKTAAAVGFGTGHQVAPLANALFAHARHAGITITEMLRAENQRYWSYVCANPDCCPPEGTPFDVSDHPVTRSFAATGTARVLASRAELAATVASVDGDAAEAMRHATRRAEELAARLVARVARTGRRASARRLVANSGLQAVARVISQYRHGETIGPEVAAWLTVVLRDLRVRDDAWSRMLPEYREAHLRLWTDLTRMARPGYVPAPASLLAFVAWQSGNGALANVALDRALEDDPCYSMAQLLRMALDSGAPPSAARLPMTPEEVAASYDACEEDEDDEDDEAADVRAVEPGEVRAADPRDG